MTFNGQLCIIVESTIEILCVIRYSETCLLRPLKGLCQVVLIEQVVFIARSSNLTLNSDPLDFCL